MHSKVVLQQKSASLCNSTTKHPQSGFGVMHLQFLLLVKHSLIGGVAVSHFMSCERQNGHDADQQGQVDQVQGDMETRQQQGHGNTNDAPRPGEEEQQGVREGAEDQSRNGQDESEQRGAEPGVQRQRRQQERHCCLAQGCCLKDKNAIWK